MKQLFLLCAVLFLSSCQYLPEFLGGVAAIEEEYEEVVLKPKKPQVTQGLIAPIK
jgi:hypothetical protein